MLYTYMYGCVCVRVCERVCTVPVQLLHFDAVDESAHRPLDKDGGVVAWGEGCV